MRVDRMRKVLAPPVGYTEHVTVMETSARWDALSRRVAPAGRKVACYQTHDPRGSLLVVVER